MTTVNDGNLFADLPNQRADEQFDLLLRKDACRLERIISTGHATPPGEWYDQDGDEWVVLLQGRAGLRLADEPNIRELKPGDYVWLPAHCRHRVEWTSDQPPAVWLALHLKDRNEAVAGFSRISA
ncbi:MAG: cupin domain-containing protein [Candidatus Contendobacter sp.]|nr:cupin domain-containing protein [Gammaproteobacteria bacterium]MCC8994010.1 cupin domain-containing protein [Candidatus Contendobacter sp.]